VISASISSRAINATASRTKSPCSPAITFDDIGSSHPLAFGHRGG